MWAYPAWQPLVFLVKRIISLSFKDVNISGFYCTGPHTFTRIGCRRITSVGKEYPGSFTKLVNVDEEGNGEICMYGRHVFMGYLHEDEKTKEVIDEGGWLRTGDIGKKDKDGFLFVTGRIKELIITAGGENIAPLPVEDAVKAVLPVVSNCMIIGDKRKFLSMLITLKSDIDTDSQEPKDKLTDQVIEWCRSIGSTANNVSDIVGKNDEAVMKSIQQGIDKVNKAAVSRASVIQKWTILPKDFSIPGGELGPTLKLRRPIVVKMYQSIIDAFYAA
ncbi:hypothetical protein SNE40_018091 [Patella caerulea]|uniref:AMP-dependent synthetase/ligase domain-containing protein n=1 Tax=Patella caerulea TaxID=87958 RepID=A0AAN8J730_PATCE